MQRQAKPQDRSARFETLFRAEYPAVFGYVARRAEPDVVDDLVDEVFLVVWRRLEQVPTEPRAWILAVARNVLGTHIRTARRNRALHRRLASIKRDWTAPAPSADRRAAEALGSLGTKDREALLLVSWEGLTPSEAAVVLGERPASFRSRLHRARSRFRQALEDSDIDAGSSSHDLAIEAAAGSTEVPNV